MEKRSLKQGTYILLACFIISRVMIKLAGVSFGYGALASYWQYLDIESLQHNLLESLWYLPSQPPFFNFVLGIVIKCGGSNSPLIFEGLFLFISFLNAYLLFVILKKITRDRYLPILISLLYLLSPATMLYENELFYTSFLSLLLLSAVYFIVEFSNNQSWFIVCGIFTALSLLCLTKGMYHLIWLMLIMIVLLYSSYPKKGFNKIVIGSLLSICLVGGWYAKNYYYFDSFSPSSWIGINFFRIVFHDIQVKDSTSIASVHPFYPISYYKRFISDDHKTIYRGMNDRVLLKEMKNDSFINMHHAGYLQVSEKYMKVSMDYVKRHPSSYFKNAFKSFVIFFTPASSYFRIQDNNNRIRYFDLVYSFNLSHFFKEKASMKIALAISALPKFFIYLFTFFVLLKNAIKRRCISFLNVFIVLTITYVMGVSTTFEYGENMRFRYEVEPLFLILLAQVVSPYLSKNIIRPADR